MRRIFGIALALGIVVAGPAGAIDGKGASTKAKLGLVRGTPLKLRGTHFVPGERVSVRVVSGKQVARRVKANRAGAFVVGYPDLALDRCNGFSATAVGARGSRATLKLPQAYCPPRI